MGKLVHKLPSITLSRLSFCTLGPIFQKKWPNWNSRVCVFIQAPKFCPSFYTLEISKCVHSCLKQSSIMWTIKSKHCVPGGVCCVKFGGKGKVRGSVATLARTGPASGQLRIQLPGQQQQQQQQEEQEEGIGRSQVSSPASVTGRPPGCCSYCLTTVKSGKIGEIGNGRPIRPGTN